MGHRNLFDAFQMFENEHENSWNPMHTEQHNGNSVRAVGTSENGPLFCPMENSTDGVHFSSHWNSAARSSGYATSSQNIEAPQYQPDTTSPSQDFFLHPPAAGAYSAAPENHAHHASSSSFDRQFFHGVEGNFIDLTMSSGRGPHKRKSPGIPADSERGSSSRYPGVGSSSGLALSCEYWPEKQTLDSQTTNWDRVGMTSTHRGNGLSIRGEGSTRNVRSRPAIDLQTNLARNHISHSSYSASHSQPVDHPSSMELSGHTSGALTQEWAHTGVSPGHGRLQVADSNGFNYDTNCFLGGGNATNVPLEDWGFNHEFVSGRNPVVTQSIQSSATQSVRSARSNYSRRPSPTIRASSSSMRLGHVAPPTEGMQMAVESLSSRHPLPLSAVTWRNSERNGRPRVSSDRYRSLPGDAAFNERFSSEGFMIVDRSAAYGSRVILDQHRDMRLDIDNMTYEELLALEERIGSVNTGLSEDSISKCLTERFFFDLDSAQEKGYCVICLEEYRDMDAVGALKSCSHDYHVSCIKKWLSMKNTCPICKAPALDDDKGKQ